jgi:hypothetical protein
VVDIFVILLVEAIGAMVRVMIQGDAKMWGFFLNFNLMDRGTHGRRPDITESKTSVTKHQDSM